MSTSAADDLTAYADAVFKMKSLPASNPMSWTAQAEIHRDYCPHRNAYFLPWHRAYLHYFEEICRAQSGKADFALPYWNWTNYPHVPSAFWKGSLNDNTRIIGNNQLPDTVVGADAINNILAIKDFEEFGSFYVKGCPKGTACQRKHAGMGTLEGEPHNRVHNDIGGNMATGMSPLDPIFWMHHSNIDRLWVEWNKTNPNGDDDEWKNFVLSSFTDSNGQTQNPTVASTFDTEALGYRYDTQ